MELHTSLDCLGFMAIGALIGYLFCHVKYRMAEATAAILRGKSVEQEKWMTKEARTAVSVILTVVMSMIALAFTVRHSQREDDKIKLSRGQVYIPGGWYPQNFFKTTANEKP